MMEARRLLDAGSERERALLRAGADETPTEESVRAAARMLGLVPRAALLASFAALLAKAAKWSVLNGYVLAPALAVGVVTTAYAVSMHHSVVVAAPVAPHAIAIEPSAASAQSVSAATADAPIAAPSGTDSTSTAANAKDGVRNATDRTRVSRTPRGGAPPAPADETLQEQVALVDRARALETAGDPSGALRAIDSYDKRFPRGLLSEEALLLRIEAVAARGDRGSATALAQRFHAEYPRSVHTGKIRWLLGNGAN